MLNYSFKRYNMNFNHIYMENIIKHNHMGPLRRLFVTMSC